MLSTPIFCSGFQSARTSEKIFPYVSLSLKSLTVRPAIPSAEKNIDNTIISSVKKPIDVATLVSASSSILTSLTNRLPVPT